MAKATKRYCEVGALVKGRGVYLGPWQAGLRLPIVHVYMADEFMKAPQGMNNGSHERLNLAFNAAVKELASRNGKRMYGNGTEAALRRALKNESYVWGDAVLPPVEFLLGKNARGESVRYPFYTRAFWEDVVYAKAKEVDQFECGFFDGGYTLSCSQQPNDRSGIILVSMSGGYVCRSPKGRGEGGILPIRIFPEPV